MKWILLMSISSTDEMKLQSSTNRYHYIHLYEVFIFYTYIYELHYENGISVSRHVWHISYVLEDSLFITIFTVIARLTVPKIRRHIRCIVM